MGKIGAGHSGNGRGRAQKPGVSMGVINGEINSHPVNIDLSVFKKTKAEKETLKQMKALSKLK